MHEFSFGFLFLTVYFFSRTLVVSIFSTLKTFKTYNANLVRLFVRYGIGDLMIAF